MWPSVYPDAHALAHTPAASPRDMTGPAVAAPVATTALFPCMGLMSPMTPTSSSNLSFLAKPMGAVVGEPMPDGAGVLPPSRVTCPILTPAPTPTPSPAPSRPVVDSLVVKRESGEKDDATTVVSPPAATTSAATTPAISLAKSKRRKSPSPKQQRQQQQQEEEQVALAAATPMKRRRVTPEQLHALASLYAVNTFPPVKVRERLAEEQGLSFKTVSVWFQNKRSLARRAARLREMERWAQRKSADQLRMSLEAEAQASRELAAASTDPDLDMDDMDLTDRSLASSPVTVEMTHKRKAADLDLDSTTATTSITTSATTSASTAVPGTNSSTMLPASMALITAANATSADTGPESLTLMRDATPPAFDASNLASGISASAVSEPASHHDVATPACPRIPLESALGMGMGMNLDMTMPLDLGLGLAPLASPTGFSDMFAGTPAVVNQGPDASLPPNLAVLPAPLFPCLENYLSPPKQLPLSPSSCGSADPVLQAFLSSPEQIMFPAAVAIGTLQDTHAPSSLLDSMEDIGPTCLPSRLSPPTSPPSGMDVAPSSLEHSLHAVHTSSAPHGAAEPIPTSLSAAPFTAPGHPWSDSHAMAFPLLGAIMSPNSLSMTCASVSPPLTHPLPLGSTPSASESTMPFWADNHAMFSEWSTLLLTGGSSAESTGINVNGENHAAHAPAGSTPPPAAASTNQRYLLPVSDPFGVTMGPVITPPVAPPGHGTGGDDASTRVRATAIDSDKKRNASNKKAKSSSAGFKSAAALLAYGKTDKGVVSTPGSRGDTATAHTLPMSASWAQFQAAAASAASANPPSHILPWDLYM
ncbi:hypothetical protein CXG81DRAFT_20535 [Caulochytrium protostelioides]|nr:hypothetical protein CXG81DRAFT_20535 [Caulochytrium protostelioides]|eukprot:RKO99359.1 hypothetical protein CXG81DRAFT_20535 [Caulochytrium protostelioides]